MTTIDDTSASHTLNGGVLKDKIFGNGGDDIIDGKGNDDFLDGGSGDDTIDGGFGNDTIHGGGNNDTVFGGLGDDNIFGDDGDDTLNGGIGQDTIDGGDGDDEIFGNEFDDILHGGKGNDDLIGGLNNDTLFGDAGNDKLIGGVSDDELHGGEGDDILVGARKEPFEDFTGNDDLFGDAGNDILAGGHNDDLLDGGEGFDIASYDAVDEISGPNGFKVTLDLLAHTAKRGLIEKDTLISIEGARGGTGDDTFDGDDNNNLFEGRDGADTLNGAGGSDTIEGGAGADILNGGSGIDTASYAASNAGVVVDLISGSGSGGHAGGDTLALFENLTGSAFDDALHGSDDANVFKGGAGADFLDGRGDVDTASYENSAEGVTARLSTGVGAGGDAEGDTFAGIENLTGSGHNDILAGNATANVLSGGFGADRLTGGGGDDTLDGGRGNDTMLGGGGSDSYLANGRRGIGQGADVINDGGGAEDRLVIRSTADVAGTERIGNDLAITFSNGDTILIQKHFIVANRVEFVDAREGRFVLADGMIGGSAGGLISGTSGADSMDGNGGGDILFGAGGDDRILGGEGDDVMNGGLGHDILRGGSGADRFEFGRLAGRDVISDFETGADTIALDQSAFGLEGMELADVVNLTGDTSSYALPRFVLSGDVLYFDSDWRDTAGREAVVTIRGDSSAISLSDFAFF